MLLEFSGPIEAPLAYPLWTQPFPGLSASPPFGTKILVREEWDEVVSSAELADLGKITRDWEQIAHSVDIFVRHLTNLKEKEGSPDIVICAPPLVMMDTCILAQGSIWRRQSERGRTRERGNTNRFSGGQQSLLGFVSEPDQAYLAAVQRRAAENFHHLLKAKAMAIGKVTQLILPSTLQKYHGLIEGHLQDRATVARNFCVAMLYKADTRPWRIARIPSGTCYVGVSFYREKKALGGRIGVSLAQVFTPEGEGLD